MADTIVDGKVVGIHYTLRDDAGAVLDSSSGGDPLQYLHGVGNIIPGLEAALAGRSVGEHLEVVVESEDAYGERDDGDVHVVPRSQIPAEAEVEVGMQLVARRPDGTPVPVWITAMSEESVTIDFNHPLAGRRLHFEVDVSSVREASDSEREHGHPHHPGCEH
jgi:FKBP-type peptidyl-prolyl cis-trans isomerase SlyD